MTPQEEQLQTVGNGFSEYISSLLWHFWTQKKAPKPLRHKGFETWHGTKLLTFSRDLCWFHLNVKARVTWKGLKCVQITKRKLWNLVQVSQFSRGASGRTRTYNPSVNSSSKIWGFTTFYLLYVDRELAIDMWWICDSWFNHTVSIRVGVF